MKMIETIAGRACRLFGSDSPVLCLVYGFYSAVKGMLTVLEYL